MPSFTVGSEQTQRYHKNYFEMLAEILEIPCQRPLKFAGGNALSELNSLVAMLKKT
jgi:hypothetical protein